MSPTPITKTSYEPSPLFKARAAGFFWLMTIITGMFGFIAGTKFIVPGDAAATATNIMSQQSIYRWAIAASVIAGACYLAVTVLVYELLRTVNRTVATLGLTFSLVGCAAGTISCLLLFPPLNLLGGASYLTAFSPAQLQGQALTFLTLSLQVNDIGMAFFGLHVITIGYLIRRSAFLPRILGALLLITGVCYLTNSFAQFLAVPFRGYLLPLVALAGLGGEGSLTGWFLVKGINLQRWKEQAAAASQGQSFAALPLETAAP
jgi:uncharacterized protein DUF4386